MSVLKEQSEGEKNNQELAKKYELIVQQNRYLEKRLQEEVVKNKQKDTILIEQSRLAAMGGMVASIGHQWRQPLNNLSLIDA